MNIKDKDKWSTLFNFNNSKRLIIDKQKQIIKDILPKYSYSKKDNFQKNAQIKEPK